jgi:acyl-CoA thioesterase-1
MSTFRPVSLLLAAALLAGEAASTAAPPPPPPVVAFLGDSLTAGLGLQESDAYPARVGEMLAAKGKPVRIVNGGVSGDTTAGGLRRVDWLLKQKPAVLVVWLGANDGLRGFPVAETEKNLRAIVRKAKASGAKVLLCGMLVPTNYGPDYGRDFRAIFPRVAKEEGAALSPFPLAPVAGRPELNQADGIHPTAEGQKLVAAIVARDLLPLLEAHP